MTGNLIAVSYLFICRQNFKRYELLLFPSFLHKDTSPWQCHTVIIVLLFCLFFRVQYVRNIYYSTDVYHEEFVVKATADM